MDATRTEKTDFAAMAQVITMKPIKILYHLDVLISMCTFDF